MRFWGRSEPAAGAGPRTGQPGCLMPRRMVFASEMLSRRVRPLIRVATTSRAAESGSDLAPTRLESPVDAVEARLVVSRLCSDGRAPGPALASPAATAVSGRAVAGTRLAVLSPVRLESC